MVSVYNFVPPLGRDDATFQPCSPRALSSLKVVGITSRGFFAEDVFIGGHPQFFAIFNSAERLYDALITWDLTVFGSHVQVMTHKKGSPEYKVLRYVREWANKVAKATPDDHVLVECFHKKAHMDPAEWFAASHRRSPSSTPAGD
ncbi:hypothetical protein EDB92DRAFT_1944585 [Lactarius akahatsu]|uniref:Uncharacterized protein n=1 Tax=Lactarius akahatsu TaxID=416441 RepID=A0AAD4QBQ3_9AGAM|nr:hypothetical protein EDB92DRAFT_1944585 [Lactarius akahatsu]